MREERSKTTFTGGIFHAYSRGTDGRSIFIDNDDYWSYLERLSTARRSFGITPLAYCLMPNHVHLLLRQDGDSPIASLIQMLHTSHAKRFNMKHGRRGHLFQGRFRQAVISQDRHLRHVIAYIHLNPVEAGLVDRSEEYLWNSHLAYVGDDSAEIVDTQAGLATFGGKTNYKKFLQETAERPAAKRWGKIRNFTVE